MGKGVLVCGEVTEGKVAAITTELLGCGRKLADSLGEELAAVLMGSGVKAVANELVALGADKVYVVDDALLQDYQADAYKAAMLNVIKQADPNVVLLGQTAVGKDLGPRLAFNLGTAISTDCLELDIDDNKRLVQTRPVYGGNARAVFTTDKDPQMATIRTKAMAPAVADTSRTGEVVDVAAGVDASVVKAKVVDKVKEEVVGIKMEDAPVVVAGGRGMGGPEGFAQLEELATLLKGATGGSRPATDNGWVPVSKQVGLTGKIVTPDLYIAVAISGSSQHMAGCSGSKAIVAVNKDPEANIFKEAQFGVVGDWKAVIPAFTAKVKELL